MGKTKMTWVDFKDYKEEGDTSFNEFDKCHDKGNEILSDIRELLEMAQNYNVNQSAIDCLDTALEEIQKFCNNVMDCKCNIFDYYKKNFGTIVEI